MRNGKGKEMKHKHGGDVYRNPNVIDFSANLNPLGMPHGVKEAAIEGIRCSELYPDVECEALRMAISEAEEIPYDQIICGNGAADLIFSLCLARKPKRALLPAPTFAEYEQALTSIGCEIEYYLLREEDKFRLESDFLNVLREDIDLLFLCNPNNPTGQPVEKQLVLEILERCKTLGIFVVIDECFVEFMDEYEVNSRKAELNYFHNMFLLKAFTKIYAMPGLRLGYGFCSDLELLADMKEVMQPWNVSVPAQYAGVAAMKEKELLVRTRKLIQKERKFLLEQLQHGLVDRVYGSSANFIFFRSSHTLREELLKVQIMIRDCSNYYGLEPGYYRIAIRTHDENEKLVMALKEITKLEQNCDKQMQSRNGEIYG